MGNSKWQHQPHRYDNIHHCNLKLQEVKEIFGEVMGKKKFPFLWKETVYPNNQFQVWCLRAQHKNTRKYTTFKGLSISEKTENFMGKHGRKQEEKALRRMAINDRYTTQGGPGRAAAFIEDQFWNHTWKLRYQVLTFILLIYTLLNGLWQQKITLPQTCCLGLNGRLRVASCRNAHLVSAVLLLVGNP